MQTYKTYLKIPFVLVVARSTSKGIFVFKITMEKKCTTCEVLKNLDDFHSNKYHSDGKKSSCKLCENQKKRKFYEKNKKNNINTLEFINLFQKNHGFKRCIKCEVLKSLDDFGNDKRLKSGKQARCYDCKKEDAKKYYNKEGSKELRIKYQEENKEKLLKKNKDYRQNNKIKIAKKQSLYKQTHKEKLNEYSRNYVSKKKKENILFNLETRIRSNIFSSLRRRQYTKKTKTYNILKCEFDFFINWLNGVASNSYTYGIGNLELDHVVPISLAQTEDEILLLCHYSNYQLLSADENLTKGNRYVNPTNLKRVLEHHPEPNKIKEIYSRL